MAADRRLAIVVLGTLAIHGGIVLVFDNVDPPDTLLLSLVPPKAEIELVDIEPPPPPPEPEPPAPTPEPEPAAPEPEPPTPAPRAPRAPSQPRVAAAASTNAPAAPNDVATPGGAPVLKMDNLGPGTTGVAVQPGPRTTGKHGRGGSGGGEGTGTGTGSADAAPVSIASIKKRAMPKGDYDYGKDYPAEAQRLGIEGTIRVRLTVDASGKVTAARLLNKLGHGLDELALSRARKLEFHPAIDTNDKPVGSTVVWTFYFTLPAGA